MTACLGSRDARRSGRRGGLAGRRPSATSPPAELRDQGGRGSRRRGRRHVDARRPRRCPVRPWRRREAPVGRRRSCPSLAAAHGRARAPAATGDGPLAKAAGRRCVRARGRPVYRQQVACRPHREWMSSSARRQVHEVVLDWWTSGRGADGGRRVRHVARVAPPSMARPGSRTRSRRGGPRGSISYAHLVERPPSTEPAQTRPKRGAAADGSDGTRAGHSVRPVHRGTPSADGVRLEALVVDLAVGGAADRVDGEHALGRLVGRQPALHVGDDGALVERRRRAPARPRR